MKKLSVILTSIVIAAGSLAAEVEVTFENPENYRDIDYNYNDNSRGQKIFLPQIEKHIIRMGKRFFKDGQSLSMVITDIDLAGDHEPWRGPALDDVRIVRSIYPPRISFSYELKDSSGSVIASGDENLSDLNFDFRLRTNSHDNLFYEKEMITDWFRKLPKPGE